LTAEARALGNIAAVYHAHQDAPHAVDAARRSLDVSRRCGDQLGSARQLNNLGTLFVSTGDLTRASECFEQAYEASKQLGWREGMASAAAGRDRAKVVKS
jgi:tetratricopeptide (TPR) repeat protein